MRTDLLRAGVLWRFASNQICEERGLQTFLKESSWWGFSWGRGAGRGMLECLLIRRYFSLHQLPLVCFWYTSMVIAKNNTTSRFLNARLLVTQFPKPIYQAGFLPQPYLTLSLPRHIYPSTYLRHFPTSRDANPVQVTRWKTEISKLKQVASYHLASKINAAQQILAIIKFKFVQKLIYTRGDVLYVR